MLLLVASLVGAAETSKYLWVLLGMAAAAGRLSEASEPWPGRNPAPQPTVRPQPETPVAGSGA